jgi:quercetin dioxygenase-like cupin family protein
METRDVRDLVHFDEDGARQQTLYETDQLFSRVICLQENQGLGPMGDPRADAICLMLAGEASVQVSRGRSRVKQWETVLVPAGSDLTIRNASEEPAVVLLVTAPPPDIGDPLPSSGTEIASQTGAGGTAGSDQEAEPDRD